MGLKPVLIAFAGLPGTGKTTIARLVAKTLGATYLRVDTAEQALRQTGEIAELVTAGYSVLYALAADNLALGQSVVADSVNPVTWSRNAWRDVATGAAARLIGVEVICDDQAEHRRRVETRRADIAGHELPDWQAVVTREYLPWSEADLRIDTSEVSAEEATARIVAVAKSLSD